MSKIDRSGRAIVTQDNKLIEACYGLTLNEKRLLLIGISKVNSMQFPDKKEPLQFMITIDDWMVIFPDTSNPYRDIKRAANDLGNKFVKFKTTEPGMTENRVYWCDNIQHFDGESKISIRFGWTITLYLQGMLEHFTSYDIFRIGRLTSVHSVRLYELLSQFRSTGFRVISLEDFRFSLDVVDAYPQWGNLNRFVIRRAVTELNEKTTLNINYVPVKTGKKVTAIKFAFSDTCPDIKPIEQKY